MSTFEQYLAIGVVIPLISFVMLAFFGHRIGKPAAGWVATVAIMLSCVLSGMVFFRWMGLPESERTELTAGAARYTWAYLGTLPITVGVKLDSLTVAMYFMVTFVAGFIHVFSIGYMAGHSDEVYGVSKYHRFFAYLSLFCFSMLGLVISSSLLFMFIFWELVGLCSYLLIGFYFDRKYASNAAMKAFITNRVGDFGFLCGLMLVVLYLGTFDLDQAAVTFELASVNASEAPMAHTSAFAQDWMARAGPEAASTASANATRAMALFTMPVGFLGFGFTLATLMGIGLFCGAIGKSAQVPLQVWLPDAMAGPTPVSALIHAATMVAAGVYLVARIYRLLTPSAQMFIAVIGCATLTIAALIAIVQTDIKKVLAYSTLSQLGYMIFGMGVGAWTAALFHLITHAFFKALMFLGSGQVIEGCHHEQDIRKMGGLRSKMPVTCWTFFIGVLAIAGFGLPGAHLGVGGYFSKDEILAVAYDRSHHWDVGEHMPEWMDPHAPAVPHERREGMRLEPHGAAPIRAGHGLVAGASASAEEGHGEDVHSASARLPILQNMPPLPRGMFWLALIIAYVTPFYMMRCWWLTFMGKPRDHHVHEHAHETPMMYVPLIVLAIGTFVSSYLWFRPLLAHAAPAATDAAMVVGLDGAAEAGHAAAAGEFINLHAAHEFLNPRVGWSWLAGFLVAWLIYRSGLATAQKLVKLPFVGTAHHVLENKLYFDHVYDFVLVRGCVGLAKLCRYVFDALVDGIVNVSAALTARFASWTGRQLDMPIQRGDLGLVDAVVNGVAEGMFRLGDGVRRPQSAGRIRVYVMVAAGSAAIVLLAVLFGPQIVDGISAWMKTTAEAKASVP